MTLCTLTLAFVTAFAQQADSVSRWGVSLSATKGKVVATDQYVKKWLKRGDNLSLALELMRAPLPKDSDAFAADYGNPTFAFGLRYTFNNAVKLHRDADADWGRIVPVAYDSIAPFIAHEHGKLPIRSVVAWAFRRLYIIRRTPSTTSLSGRMSPSILLQDCTKPCILHHNGGCGPR